MTLLLAGGFQRLLAHGVAQFHGLRSASRLAWPGETVCCLTGLDSVHSPDAGTATRTGTARVLVLRQQRSEQVDATYPSCYMLVTTERLA